METYFYLVYRLLCFVSIGHYLNFRTLFYIIVQLAHNGFATVIPTKNKCLFCIDYTFCGITLTLTLNMTFGSGFAGNRVFYLAARDVNEQNNAG